MTNLFWRAALVQVFDGKAIITSGDRQVELKKGREISLNGPLKAQKFDRKQSEDALYAWSNLRSEYEAQASMQSASTVVVGGPGWYGPGWYWNPWSSMYGFVPGAGINLLPLWLAILFSGCCISSAIYRLPRLRPADG